MVPFYKGKGDRSKPSAHRPISLCPCLDKLLEKVILKQFTTHINSVKPLSSCQFGFREGRSTVDNYSLVIHLLLSI